MAGKEQNCGDTATRRHFPASTVAKRDQETKFWSTKHKWKYLWLL